MIIATLLMRDEEEIVRENIEHHLANGVDAFLVTLHRSVDRTREILREYRRVLEVYERQEEAYNQASFVTRMAQEACRFKPDWIVHLDADEFWVGLRQLHEMPADIGLVTLTHAFEHRPSPGMMFGEFRREQMPDFDRVPFNKVMHRPSTRIRIHQGNHNADRHWGRAVGTDAITIHHYPIRSYAHFERKVVQGGQAYAASPNLPQGWGRHWRDWYEKWLVNGDALREIYERMLAKAETLEPSKLGHSLADSNRKKAERRGGSDEGVNLQLGNVAHRNTQPKNGSDGIEPLASTRIPNILHFCHLRSGDSDHSWGPLEYLAIRSAIDINQPDITYLHCDELPTGRWWDRIAADVTPVQLVPPTEVHGKRIRNRAHQADLIRLDALIQHGGIYLDLDTLCLRPFRNLRDHPFVMSIQPGRGLCNAVMLGEPGASFARRWKESYRTFDDAEWDHHSVVMPAKLAGERDLRDCITVLPSRAFFFPMWTEMDQLLRSTDSSLFAESYCVHYWAKMTHGELREIDEGWLHTSPYNLARFARRHL